MRGNMKTFCKFALMITLFSIAVSAQVPAPQINLTGNIGCQGFPCVNTGTLIMATDANRTMTAQETSAPYIKVTSSVSLTATRNLVAPSGNFPFTIENATTGAQSIQIIGPTGTGVLIANGTTVSVWYDGANYVQVGISGSYLPLSGGTLTGALNGTSASFSGTVNAPSFIGPLTGNVTGHSSLDLPLTGGAITGALNGTSASFSGNVVAGAAPTPQIAVVASACRYLLHRGVDLAVHSASRDGA